MSEAHRRQHRQVTGVSPAIGSSRPRQPFELADILTVRAAQHLDNAALIEAADEERLKKPNGEIERVSAELKLEKAVAGHRPHRGRIAQSVRAAR
jgi:hypothetical protein